MKKSTLLFALLLAPMLLFAIPAKRNLWQNITLADGSTVYAMLQGDENSHFFTTADGRVYLPIENNRYVLMDDEPAVKESFSKRANMRRSTTAQRRSARMNKAKKAGNFIGEKKALVILVQFSDKPFRANNDLDRYKKIINEIGFNESPFKGSVRDYFRAQSHYQFDLNFDVVGPYTMPKGYAYYGQNDQYGEDMHPGEMIATALQIADNEVDFSHYDWDGDGEVEQVFILYAGQGAADGGASNTIWPHEWELQASDYGETLSLDGVTINTYACGNELNGSNQITGIGTMCHEFSHCMGFPDFYDTSQYGSNYGMGDWDLMCSGSYNGDGYCPAGYTSYERITCGWMEPVELVNDTAVADMKPINDGGEAYIVYNKAYPDEYILLENRNQTGWDANIPNSGLLVLYVDYDETIWQYNYPNAIVQYQGLPYNTHERMTVIPANNQKNNYQQYGHTYPYNNNDSLTNTSRPSLRLNNPNTDGKKLLNVGILKIKRNSDSTVSFNFRGTKESIVIDDTRPENAIFYESFDQCAGSGGNDDVWSGATTGAAEFRPDCEGWESQAMSGANKCAKFGSGSKIGEVTTPEFTIDRETKFSFRAAPWGNDGTSLTLSVSGNATIEPVEFTMTSQKWTICEATINGNGPVKVTLTPTKRFFLDHIAAVPVGEPNSISDINFFNDDNTSRIYSIDGRYVGTDINSLGRGIYIINGHKFVK